MATVSERLALLISADVDDAVRGLNKLDREAGKSIGSATSRADELGSKLTRVGAGMLATGTLAVVGLGHAARATSDLNEATAQTEQIFDDAADEVGDFAKTAASSIGQSERAARDATSEFGLLLKNMKFGQDETVQWSKDLTVLASDMASFKNTSPEEAILALGAALRGESEPIRRYGVMLDDASVRQRAVEMGFAATTAAVDDHGKAQARLAIIMESTTDMQGDFARNSDSLANSQRTFNAQLEGFQAALGEGVLPLMETMLGLGNDMLGWFNELDPATQTAISSLVTYAAAGVAAGGGLALLTGKLVQARVALLSMTAASRAATIGMGGLGVALVAIAAGYHLYSRAVDEAAEREERWQGLIEAKASAARRVASTLDDMTGGLTNASKELVATELAAMGLADNFEAAGFSGERLWAVLDQTAEVSDETRREFKALLAEIYAGSEITNEQEKALDDLLGGFTEGHRIWKESRGLIGDVSAATDDATEAAKNLDRAWSDLTASFAEFDAQTDAELLLQDTVDLLDRIADMSGPDARAELSRLATEYLEVSASAATAGEDVNAEMEAIRLGFAAAGAELGLTADEFGQFTSAFDSADGRRISMSVSVSTSGLEHVNDLLQYGGHAPVAPPTPSTYGGLTATEWAQLRDQEIVIHNNLSVDGRVLAETVTETRRLSGGLIE